MKVRDFVGRERSALDYRYGVYSKVYRRRLLLAALLIAVSLPGFSQSPALQDERDLVHFGDLIDLDVAGGLEFDWRGTLSPEGYLNGLNTFGDPVFGLCRKESDIAADVAKAYSKFLRDPQVTVRIIDRSNRAVATWTVR